MVAIVNGFRGVIILEIPVFIIFLTIFKLINNLFLGSLGFITKLSFRFRIHGRNNGTVCRVGEGT